MAVLVACSVCAHASVLDAIQDLENAASASKISEEAMKAFPTSENERRQYVEALNQKAQGLFRNDKVNEALTVWERIVVIDPKNVQNLMNVGLTLHDIGKKREAMEYLRKAAALQPDDPGVHYQLYRVAEDAGEALKELRVACKLEPDAIRHGLIGHLAAHLQNAHRYEESEHHFKRIFRTGHTTVPDLMNHADLMVTAGRPAEGLVSLRKALLMLENPTAATAELPKQLLDSFKSKASVGLARIVGLPAHIPGASLSVGADGKMTVPGDGKPAVLRDVIQLARDAVRFGLVDAGPGDGDGRHDPSVVDPYVTLAMALDKYDESACARDLGEDECRAEVETMEREAEKTFSKAVDLANEQLKDVLQQIEKSGFDSLTVAQSTQHRSMAMALAPRRSYAREQNKRLYKRQPPDLSPDESGFVVRSSSASGWVGGRRPSAVALGPGTCTIPRRDVSTLSVEDFHKDYVDAGKPVLLYGENAVAGKVWGKWTKTAFVATYGKAVVRAVGSTHVVLDQTFGVHNQSFNISIADYVANFTGHADEAALFNPPYLFKQRQIPGISADVDAPAYFADRARFSWSDEHRANASLFFIGPTLSGAYFHAHYAAWNAVVYGRKRWLLMPPGAFYGTVKNGDMTVVEWLHKYGMHVQALDCVQEPGTMLFIPEGWSHATINLDDTIGIAIEVGPSTAF